MVHRPSPSLAPSPAALLGRRRLLGGALRPAPGARRIGLALAIGLAASTLFAAAVLTMIVAMAQGLSIGRGTVPWPWAALANAALVVQFPLLHSLLLTRRGRHVLPRLMPRPHGATLATTTYALIASIQLLLQFGLLTASGIVWWRAEGTTLWLVLAAYGAAWLLLLKASVDAGAEVQSGALGWLSLLQGVRPVFPDMPERGLFRVIRQPIYVAFAMTLWAVPVWTPDQLALAVAYTAYCLLAPRLKERRFLALYGERFRAYRARAPYALPRLRPRVADG